jgi:hypothetical protein
VQSRFAALSTATDAFSCRLPFDLCRTVGKMIELLAGKAGVISGQSVALCCLSES